MMGRSDSTRTYPRGTRVATTIQAMRGHASPGAAHQHELRVRSDARTLMHAYRAAGAPEVGEAFLRDLRAALSPEAPVLTDDLILRACRTDSDEETPQTAFLADRNVVTARRWRLRLEADHAVAEELIRALRSYEETAQ